MVTVPRSRPVTALAGAGPLPLANAVQPGAAQPGAAQPGATQPGAIQPGPGGVYPDGLPLPQRYWSMIAIGIGITMAVLDSSVANVALPAIARELGAQPAQSIWIITSYQLAIVISLLPVAALGETIGYRRVYQVGIALFTVGSLCCALSHSLTALVAARTFQGFGAAGIMAVNGALVRFTYPHASLGRGVGLNALIVSAAAALGPTIASGILAVANWEWLFAINVPFGVINLVLAWRALPRSEQTGRAPDFISSGLNALMFGLFFVGAETMARGGGGLLTAGAELAGAILAAGLLVQRERAQTRPLVPIDLLRVPLFSLSVLTSVCSFAAYMLAFVSLPFFFETVLHRDQVQTGLLMTPWPVALGLVAPIAGRLSDRVPAAILGSAGLVCLAAGLGLMALLPASPSGWDIAWRMALCGLGFGFFQAPNNRTMLSAAPRNRAGAAGGMLATARLTGQTSGATIAALTFHLASAHAEPLDLVIGAGLAVAAAGVSLLRLSR